MKELKFIISPKNIMKFLEGEIFDETRQKIVINREWDFDAEKIKTPYPCFEVILTVIEG
jgi:hypothetical protein